MKQHQYANSGVIWFGRPLYALLLRLFGRKIFMMPKDWTTYKHAFGLHFRGVTAAGEKFVWCPHTLLMSWSPADYKERWCHACQKYFDEVRNA